MGAAAWAVLVFMSAPPAAAQPDLDIAVDDEEDRAPVPGPTEGPTAQERANMANVLEFYSAAFTAKNFERARFYLGEDYIQHGPTAVDGMEGFESSLATLLETAPRSERMAQAVYAEGDFVILHARSHGEPEPDAPDRAVVDIFRLNGDGKVVEHWEIAQDIPAEARNENGMFYEGETPDPTPLSPEQEDANRAVAVEFYERALNRKDWAAASELIGPTYIEHDPTAADGAEGLQARVERLASEFPESRGEIQAAYADGDRVILHVHARRALEDRGDAVVYIFRIVDGLVVEHWEVAQPMPEASENENGMFYSGSNAAD